MRFLITLLAIFALFNCSLGNTATNAGEFLLGFAQGVEITLNSNSQACLSGVTSTLDEFQTAFQLIDSGFKSKSVNQVKTGITDLGLAIQQIPVDYEACKITQLVQEIEEIASKLSSGVDGIVDIILKEAVEIWEHKNDLSSDFKTAIADWKSSDFNGSGVAVGSIVGDLIQGAN
ncbi:hypothetical protein RB653_004418 [Dictyostelium firmibasis]|uniref:Uncharacterized protein n=1 Tax=Dictyostelium firmibasis TaxID=79012 RepID=A0AAN7Z3B6_9MYCE